ncbi:hypothetical protein, partial [Enterococcus faecium]
QITDLTGQAKTLQDKLDALKEEISKLGNLQVMYSNSIDFGGYDYSGNPNLSAKLNASSFSSGTGATVADDNDEIVFTLDGTNQLSKYTLRTQTPLVEGKQYTISCEIMLETGFTGDPSGIKLLHSYLPGGITTLQTDTVPKNELNKWQKLIGTRTVTYGSSLPNEWYPVFKDIRNLKPSGKVRVRNIKIEEGSTATPYQPNLLDAPYYLSKVALGDNLVTNARFPIKTSSNPISGFDISEELIIGETYTVSLKGTKPANKEFQLYYGDAGNFQAALQPAEGLKDVWSATFTAKNTTGTTNLLRVALWQMPTTVTNGDVQIDWLKIEKGDTRTPNIEQYKYRGIGMRDSNNPKDYVWDLAPEYVEDNLATDIKVAEITGKANNYTDGKVSQINSQLTASINAVDTTAKDAQTKANANATAIKSTNSRVDEIDRIITALTKEETYLLPASIVSGGSLKFTSRGGMTVATGSFKLAKDIAFGEVLVDDLPDSMINIDNNAIGTGAVTGNSVSQIYVESNTRKVVANTAMKKDQWFTVGFSYHSKLSI